MDEARLDLIRVWMVKAVHDLDAARTLASDSKRLLDAAIFHCQQAAEKALKALLTFHDTTFEKTHDCRLLAQMALPHHQDMIELIPLARLLTPYAVIFRYPFGPIFPDQDEFNEALKAAETIVSFVLKVLPPQAQPGSDA